MKITLIAALCNAAAATALPMAATAHADPTSFGFVSPSGDIGCQMFDQGDGNAYVVCKIHDHTWAAAPSEYCQRAAVPGATGQPGSDLMLGQGKAACAGSAMVQIFFSGPYAAAPLAYGETHTVATITCDSEPSGVTCTDTGSGHFFRMSRESYQLG